VAKPVVSKWALKERVREGCTPPAGGHWGCAPGKSFKLQMHAGGFQGIFQTKLNTMTPAFMPVKFRKVPKRFRLLMP
jgi:hypothetical protein